MLFLQFVLYGLVAGGLYSLIACGLVVAYRASGFLDFSLPYVAMLSTICFALTMGPLGVAPALVLALSLGALVSAGLYAGIYHRLADGPLGPKVVVSLAVGLSLQVVGGLVLLRYRDDLIGGTAQRSVVPQTQLDFLPDSLALTWQQALLPVAAVVALVALLYLFQRTDFGLAVRACAQNRMSAQLAGLPRRAVERTAWAVTGLLASAAGVLALSSQSFLVPTYLFEESIRGFVAALAGGFVDFKRAVACAMVIGIVENQLVGAGGVLADLRGAVTFGLVTVIALTGLATRGRAALERAE